ncbi:hypothetical protein GCM10027594_07840 [Hymenobacter agri]
MIEHDFSQLPVVDADFKPQGIVTTDSITRALLTLGTSVKEPKVKDVFTKAPVFRADEDLLYLLDYLLKASAVFITDAEGTLTGIITDYDTTQYFRQRAEDIVLVEDIESTLKAHLRAVHNAQTEDSEDLSNGIATLNTTLDETRKRSQATLKEYCKNKELEFSQDEANAVIDKFFPVADKNRPFDDLTLSEYIQFAQKAWPKLSAIFNLPKNAWSEMMDAVREIRNKLVHFRGDISPVERAKLRYCAEWYKTHQPSQKDTAPINDASSTAKAAPVVNAENNITANADSPTTKFVPYNKITEYLNELNKTLKAPVDNFSVPLVFIENNLKIELPRAAHDHITWWTQHVFRNRVWSRDGWKVTSVNLAASTPSVTFSRITLAPPPPLAKADV